MVLYERRTPSEDEVKRYLEILKSDLEKYENAWVIDAVGGEDGLREVVREILGRMRPDEADKFKWDEFAQLARDYVDKMLAADANREAWLKALELEESVKLPRPLSESREQLGTLVDAIDRYISDLLKATTLEEAKRVLAEKFPQLFEVHDLLRERDEYKARVREAEQKLKEKEKLIESYRKKVRDLGETIGRLEAELKRYEKYKELPPDALAKYQDGLAKLRQVEEENRKLREQIAKLEEERRKAEEEFKKAKEEEAKKTVEVGEKIREAATSPPPDHLAVRFLMDYSREIIHKGKAYTVSGKTGEVKYIPVDLYDTIKYYIDRGILPKFIEPISLEEKAEVEKVEKPERVEKPIVLSDSDYNKLWKYFEEMITKKFKLSYRYVYAYKDEFNRTIERTVGFQENMKLVDELLEKIARETLLMPKVKARKIVEEKPKWVRPKPEKEVPAPEVPPLPPKVEIPKEPVSPMPFPRRLSSSEMDIFANEFRRRLIERGLNPDNYIEYWKAFRDAWHSSWDEVLRRFEELIKIIERGLPPPIYLRAMYPVPWKEIPRDPVLHLLCASKYKEEIKDMEDFISFLHDYGVDVTPEEVIKIVKEEWKKGVEMHAWLRHTPREHIKKILGVYPEDC